jgi:hypothetical protein
MMNSLKATSGLNVLLCCIQGKYSPLYTVVVWLNLMVIEIYNNVLAGNCLSSSGEPIVRHNMVWLAVQEYDTKYIGTQTLTI